MIQKIKKELIQGLGFLFLILFSLNLELQAQTCANPGRDGSGTISGIVNTYYPGSTTVLSGATSIPVGTSTGSSNPIAPGDLLLVIQMQDASIDTSNSLQYGDGSTGTGTTNLGNSGKYEYVIAGSSVSGGYITIIGKGAGNGLINDYIQAPANSGKGQSTFQVVRVPQYLNITLSSSLTALPWNGSTGGILAIDVEGVVNLGSAYVSVLGTGFRGGGSIIENGGAGPNNQFASNSNGGINGSKGEGIAGTPRYTYSPFTNTVTDNILEGYPNGSFARGAPGNAGGGATDGNYIFNNNNSGGGGGANLGNGGLGGFGWNAPTTQGGYGGTALPAGPSLIFMGGGGGAGSRNDTPGPTSSGGAGGGIVMIRAGSVTGTGTLDASGSAGQTPMTEGGGGGGAGGSIVFTVLNGNLNNLTIVAKGGIGGNADPGQLGLAGYNYHGPGGGGGGGYIYTNSSLSSANVLGGIHGTTTLDFNTYGSTNGNPGLVVANGSLFNIPGISSGALCPLKLTSIQTNNTCFGGNNGSASVSVTGGDAPYTYLWNTGAITSSISGLSAGTYSVKVLDGASDTLSKSFTITQPPAITFTFTSTPDSCNGASNGSITITALGGTGSLSYSVDNGLHYQASPIFSSLPAGTYTLLVKDSLGCTSSSMPLTVVQPLALSITVASTNISCYGNADGSITVTASGGTGSLKYSMDNGLTFQTSNVFSNLAPNTYSILVRDDNACTTSPIAVTLTQPSALNSFILSGALNFCSGNTEVLSLSNSDPGISYQLLNSGVNSGPSQAGTGAPLSFIINSGGTYNVIAINTLAGCTLPMNGSLIIVQDSIPTVSNAGPNQDLCNVTSTTLAGNNPLYGTGTWTQTSGPPSTITNPNAPNSTLTGLSAGTYVYTWTISSGTCAVSTSTVTISVYPTPDISNAGANQNLCNVTSTTLAGNIPLNGAGTWTQTSGPPSTITSPNSPNSTLTGLSAGTYVYTWTISSGTCAVSTSTVTITVYPSPDVSNAGPNQNLCNVTSTTLAGNNPVNGTGNWTWLSGPNTPVITNPSAYNSGLTGLVSGSYIFQWSITSGSCTLSSSSVSIMVSPTPDSSKAGLNQNLCNSTTATLTGNSPVNGIGTWSLVSAPNTPVISSPINNVSGVTGMIPGNYIFAWTISSGSCTSLTSIITIVNSPLPDISNAGANQSLCNVTTTTLSGNNPVKGSGSWTLISGPNTPNILNPSAYNSGLSGLVPGTYVFQWTISSGTCSTSSSNVTLVIFPSPDVSNAGPNQNLCNVSTTQLSGNTPIIGTGFWTQVSGPSCTLNNPDSSNARLSGLNMGTYVFQWTITSGSCSTSSSQVTITVAPIPSIASAGVNQGLCNVNSATLTGNVPLSGTGQWTQVSGPNSSFIISPNSPVSTVSGLTNGTYIYQWTISSGSCSVSSSQISLVVSPIPTPSSNAGMNQTLCNVSSTVLSGNTPITGVGSWVLYSGSPTCSIASPGSPTTTVNNLTPGTYVFQWTISSGACASSTSQVVITIWPTPTISNAGINQNLCNVSSTNLAGNIVTSGVGTWSQLSGPNSAIFTNPNAFNSGVTGMVSGTYTFQWTVSSGNCTVSTSTVSVTISPAPTVSNAGIDQSLCNVTTATLSGNNPVFGSGTWTQVSGPNTATISNPTVYNSGVTGMVSGNYVFQWTISSGVCVNSSSNVSIKISPTPSVAKAGPAQHLCNVTSTNLAGNTPTVGIGTWTWVSGPNTPILVAPNSPTSGLIGLISGTYTYQWTISSGACTASSSTVKIIVSPLPTVSNAGPDQYLCNLTTATLAGNIPTLGTGTWTQIAGAPSIIVSKNSANSTITGLGVGTYTYQWTISSGACASSSSQMSIVIYPLPTPSNSGPNQSICNVTTANLAGNVPVNGIGFWSQTGGPPSTIMNPNLPNSQITGLSFGTYVYTWTISSGTCITNSSSVTIIVSPLPSISYAGPNQRLRCSSNSSTNLLGNTPVDGTGLWTQVAGAPSTLTSPNSPATTVNGLSSGTYVYQWTISSGTCTQSSSQVSIVVPNPLVATIIHQTQQLCYTDTLGSATVGVTGGTPPYTYLWNTIPVQTTPMAIDLAGNNFNSYTVWVTDSSGCTTSVNAFIKQLTPVFVVVTNPPPVIAPFTVDITPAWVTAGSSPNLTYSYFLDSLGTVVLPNPKTISVSGTYYILGTNKNGCNNISPVHILINQPVLPIPVGDIGTTLANNSITLANITGNDIQGTYTIDPSTVDLDTITPGIQKTYSVSGKGTFTVNSSGQIDFVPYPNFSGIVTDYYSIGDIYGYRSMVYAPLTITVNPIASPDSVSTPSNVPVLINLVSLAKGNIDSTKLSIITSPGHGMVSINPMNGLVTYTPSPGYSASTDYFTYSICDKTKPTELCSSPAKVAVTVLPAIVPIPVGDLAMTTANASITLSDITFNDIPGTYSIDSGSVDLDTLSSGVQSTSVAPGKGTFTVNSKGQVLFIPFTNYSGLVTDYYSVADIYGYRSTIKAPILIQVNPVALPDSVFTPPITPITIDLVSKNWGNIDPTHVNLVSLPGHGKVLINPITGLVTYNPNPGFSGTDHFSYFVCDKTLPTALCSDTAQVAVTVGDPILPIPIGDQATTLANTSINLPNITANDSLGTYILDPGSIDLDPNTPGVQKMFNIPNQGSFSVDSLGKINFVPFNHYSGIVTDYYTVADIFGNRSLVRASIIITVNPVAVSDSVITPPNTPINIDLISISQGNIDPTKLKIGTPTAHGTLTVNPVTGQVTFTPIPGYSATEHFSYTVCDQTVPTSLCSNQAWVSITVEPPILPIPEGDIGKTLANTPVTLTNISSNDSAKTYPLDPSSIDLDTLTAGIQSSVIVPGKGTCTVNSSGQLKFIPALNFSGIMTDYYSIGDIYGDRSVVKAPLIITVYPVASPDTVITESNTPINLNLIAISLGTLDPSQLSINSPTLHGSLLVNPISGLVTYQPNPNYSGMDQFTYTVCDQTLPSSLCSAPAQVLIKVNPPVLPIPHDDLGNTRAGISISLPNIISNDSLGTNALDPGSIDLDVSTPGVQKTFTIPYEGSFAVDNSGNISFTPASNFSGIITESYTLADIYGNRSLKTANITITVNPVANNLSVGVSFNTPTPINILSPDLGNLNPATMTIQNQPSHGSVKINPVTGKIIFQPELYYIGTDQFTYTVCDFTSPTPLCSNTATVVINIRPPLIDLELAKTAPSKVNTDTYDYTFTITNLSSDTANFVVLTDTLPTGMNFISAQPQIPGTQTYFDSITHVFTWFVPFIQGDFNVSLNLTVNTVQIGAITNKANVLAKQTDPNLANNTSSVTINKQGDVLIFPTLFTPNGDGINDDFVVKGLMDYPDNELTIFNRWGNIVYKVSQYMHNGIIWNGENLNEGTYYYLLKVNINGIIKVYGGYTTLIRAGR